MTAHPAPPTCRFEWPDQRRERLYREAEALADAAREALMAEARRRAPLIAAEMAARKEVAS